MARRKKNSGCGCLVIIGIVLFMVFGSLIGELVREQKKIDNRKYHESMSALSNSGMVPVAGNKAVSIVEDEDGNDMFSTEYVPEELVTEEPGQVRYFLHVESGAAMVGYYSGGGGAGFRRWVEISIEDRTTRQIIASERFEGGSPPQTVSSGGNHYGSYPSRDRIDSWILEQIGGQG